VLKADQIQNEYSLAIIQHDHVGMAKNGRQWRR